MDKLNGIIKNIKGDKKRLSLVLIALVGALLILLSLGGDKREGKTEEQSLDEYKEGLERELSELCSSVEGAGRCKVSVSFSEGEKTEYRGTNKISTTPPRVLGITVIAEGGGSAEVRSALTEALTAMFDIGANRVAVLKRA